METENAVVPAVLKFDIFLDVNTSVSLR